MPDVFLSYSREDQPTARQFAEALKREGFNVWWDQALDAGESFDKVTEQALKDARAVVVLWSKHSVDSRWVRSEATLADRYGTLVPVTIGPCDRPIMFELTHTADLSGWSGDVATAPWRGFVDGLRRTVGKNPAVATRSATPEIPASGPMASRPNRIGLMAAIAMAVLLVGAAAFWYAHQRGEKASAAAPAVVAQTGPVTLAVLPFADLSQAKDQDYFSDGLTEEILNQLAQIPALRLTGRTSSFSFKGKNEDLRVIGEKLGVANLLEGSVRRDGKQLRVTAQLIRADDGTHMWSKTYDRGLDNVFAVQDEIAKDVAQALAVKLDVTTLNRSQGGTTNVEAYDRYLRWRNLFLSEQRGIEVVRLQEQLLREAVALDPQFALAWDNLARLLDGSSRFSKGATAERLKAEATQARKRVEALAPDSWMVQRRRAYSLWEEGKWPEAIAAAKAILDKGPFTIEHQETYSNLIFAVGRWDEGIALMERVKAIEPLVMFVSRDLQLDYTGVGRFAEAEAEYQRSKSLDGSHGAPDVFAFLRLLARKDGDPQELRALHRRLLEELRDPPLPRYFQDLGDKLQDREAMRTILRKAFETAPDRRIQYFLDALGDPEFALAAMRATWQGSGKTFADYSLLFLTPHSGMRALPGFKDLMRDAGLVDYWQKSGNWGDFCRPVGKEDFECH